MPLEFIKNIFFNFNFSPLFGPIFALTRVEKLAFVLSNLKPPKIESSHKQNYCGKNIDLFPNKVKLSLETPFFISPFLLIILKLTFPES